MPSLTRALGAGLTAAALTIGGAAAPAAAKKPSTVTTVAKPAAKPATPVGRDTAKARKAARFVATGTVVAVDAEARTLTVDVVGGYKNLHITQQVFTVAETAAITRNDVAALLSEVAVGDAVGVTGTRTDTVAVATHVSATSPVVPAV
jgi:hypothetical protein